jgi:hypothetical protein
MLALERGKRGRKEKLANRARTNGKERGFQKKWRKKEGLERDEDS